MIATVFIRESLKALLLAIEMTAFLGCLHKRQCGCAGRYSSRGPLERINGKGVEPFVLGRVAIGRYANEARDIESAIRCIIVRVEEGFTLVKERRRRGEMITWL